VSSNTKSLKTQIIGADPPHFNGISTLKQTIRVFEGHFRRSLRLGATDVQANSLAGL